ncbi:hypothetical protein KI688_004550 [Linnemannia hyalina]|uniref:Uncharacterized protein n=1 Tax=Linnemannia hyalina TaxID=64524 RepID=A0A9P8BP45_9FUNG|nr:hypothetical protein KI688_004550 [Linnemannia hyalina]
MLDGKVMPWLQEAMQTVTMLESRLQELEEDCKAIPLYEQDRLEMTQEIQDLDAIVQQDQGWMDHAEIVVQWTTSVLENALISSSSASHTNNHNSNGSPRQSTRTRTRTEEVMPGLGRNTRSEGTLPSLIAEKSSTLGNLSSSSESRMETGAKKQLSESSDADPSQPDLPTSSACSTNVNNTDTSRLSSASLSTVPSSSLSPNNNDSSSSSDTVAVKESQEAVYRNAIMAALQYLKTIEIAPSLSSTSSSSCKTSTENGSGRKLASRGHGSRQEQEKGARDAVKQGKRRTRTRTRGAPDRALKEWLENSSMMSLVSNIITEELLHEDEDEEGERVEDFSVSRVLATVEDMDSNRDRNTGTELDVQANTPELRSPSTSSSSQMRRCRQLLAGSLGPLQKSIDTTFAAHTITQPNLLPISTNTSTETLFHALNSTAATISGSSQSLNSILSPTFIDERVFLKQHILHLDKLRVQELNRHQKIEEGHQQLVRDLRRFSKELLGSVNELTCAQAALDEASELALLALRCLEKGVPSGGGAGSMMVVVVDMAGSQQKQQPDNVSDENYMATTTTIRQKRLVAASRKELESSGELVGECITRIRQLAADCVGITELAGKGHHYQQSPGTGGINASFIHPALNLVRNAAMDGGEVGEGELQRKEFAATVLPLESKATPIAVEKFVDGITFQEFEDHLTSIRSSSSNNNNNSAPSESNIFKRTFPSSSSSSSSARLTANNTNVGRRNHPSTTNTGQSEYMRKVLAEDIYPCLLINHNGRSPTTAATVAKRQSSGWMSAFLSSSSTLSSASSPPLRHGINNNTNSNVQGLWVQRLLKAMEANACEIEAWKHSPPPPPPVTATGNTTTNAGSMLVVNRTTTAAAPKTACCLCGSIRSCEFRLRLLDSSFSSSSTSSSSSSSAPNSSTIPSSTQPPQQQQYHALDRFCRERIVAVCDFFMFLAHLRQGLLNQPTSLELFRRALGLRQRMAYARIGSMDLVGGGGRTVGGGGGGGGEASLYVTRE